MQLAVATRSFLAQVSVTDRLEIGRFELLERGRHYGIAFPENDPARFIAISRKNHRYTVWERRVNGAVRYEQIDRFALPGNFDDVHQIAWADGGLYVANSGFNSVDFVPLGRESTEGCQRYCFDDCGSRHVNSVFPCGPQSVLVMLHNKGRKTSEVALLGRPKEGPLELVHRTSVWDMGCHNVVLDGDHLLYNASEVGDFVAVDVRTGRLARRIHFSGHTKGLSIVGDRIVLGISEYASRWARNTSRGHLAFLDRRTFDLVGMLDVNHPSLPHPIGNVNELRCLDEPDRAHAWAEAPRHVLQSLRVDPGTRREQLALRARRAVITAVKTAKTLTISAREIARRR